MSVATTTLIAIALFGCSEPEKPPEQRERPITFHRLVDMRAIGIQELRATDSRILFDPMIQPADDAATFGGDVVRRYYQNLPGSDDGSARYESKGARDDPGLRLRGLTAYARLLPVAPGRAIRVSIDIHEIRLGHVGAALLQVGHTPTVSGTNPDALFPLAVGTAREDRTSMDLEHHENGFTLTAETIIGPDTKSLLLLLLVNSGEYVLQGLAVDSSDPVHALDHVGGANAEIGRARYAAVGPAVRESFVILPDESATFLTPLIATSAVLRGDVATLAGTAPAGCSLSIRVFRTRGGEELANWTGHANDQRWHPFEIPLGRLNGETVIQVSANEETSVDPRGIVAIGAAVVEDTAAFGTDLPDAAIVSIDTVRRDRLPIYGHDRDTAPNITALARDSVVFDRAFSPASWTLPAHVSLFTGRSPPAHGVVESISTIDPQSAQVLARAFRDAGYETIAYTAGGSLAPDFGLLAGFERYCFEDPVGFELVGEKLTESTGAARVSLRETLARPANRPRFLFVHTYAAHDYLAAHDDLVAMGLDPTELARAGEPGQDIHVALGGGAELQGVALKKAQGTDAFAPSKDRLDRLYDASIRAADRLVGEVAESFPWRSVPGDVLVVASDHGEELFEHGHVGHGDGLSEELIQIPLILRCSSFAPARVDFVTSLTDVAPTIASLCGVPFWDCEGVDLSERLHGTRPTPPEPVLLGINNATGLRGLRWKIIEDGDQVSIYDLLNDPSEDHDLAEAKPAQRKRMRRALMDRVSAAKALGPTATGSGSISPEALQKLRELGYLGGS